MQLLTLIFLEVLAGAEVDLFIPSFPELQALFSLSPALVELTLSLNFLAFCLCTIIVGDLGDRFGRKIVIQAGLIIFIGGSLLCLCAQSLGFSFLLLGRFLQGAGISAPASLAYVVIADQYPPHQQEKLLGLLNGVTTLAMGSAPIIGSYTALAFGWIGNFYSLLIAGVLALLTVSLWVRSDFQKSSTSSYTFSILNLLSSYKKVCRSSKVMSYILLVCLWITPYWTFVGMAPIVYIKDLNIPLNQFGYYQGVLCFVFSIASLLAGFFIKRWGKKACFNIGLSLMGLYLVSLLLLLESRNPLWITTSMSILSLGLVFPITIIYPILLGSMEGYKGRISSLVLAIRLIFTALSLEIVSLSYTQSFYSLAIAMALSMVVSFILVYFMIKKGYLVLEP